MKNITDTHVHLEEIENLQEVLDNAIQSGITSVVAVGSDHKSNLKILELADKIKTLKIYPALGIHPTNIVKEEIETTLRFIEDNIKKIIAIGEIGLDYWYKSNNKEIQNIQLQNEVFELQLALSKKYSKPVIIHSRGAWQECYEITKSKNIQKAVFHWYSGPVEILKKIIQDGYMVSATPALEYSVHHIQAIEQSPIENILVETDTPVRYKTKNGESYISQPRDVLRTIKALSLIKNLSDENTAEITLSNAIKFFNLT